MVSEVGYGRKFEKMWHINKLKGGQQRRHSFGLRAAQTSALTDTGSSVYLLRPGVLPCSGTLANQKVMTVNSIWRR